MTEWRLEEHQKKLAIDSLIKSQNADKVLDAQRVFELANKAYLLYSSQDSTDNAKLLRMLCSKISVGSLSVARHTDTLST